MVNFQDLHLETIKIPKNLDAILEEEGFWEELDAFKPFGIIIQPVLYKGDEATCFSVEFSPDEAFATLNKKLKAQGYGTMGQDWTDYLLAMLQKNNVLFIDKISDDSEGSTCVLCAYNQNDFIILLKNISEIIRNLANN